MGGADDDGEVYALEALYARAACAAANPCVCVCICVCVYVCEYVCILVCVCICMLICRYTSIM